MANWAPGHRSRGLSIVVDNVNVNDAYWFGKAVKEKNLKPQAGTAWGGKYCSTVRFSSGKGPHHQEWIRLPLCVPGLERTMQARARAGAADRFCQIGYLPRPFSGFPVREKLKFRPWDSERIATYRCQFVKTVPHLQMLKRTLRASKSRQVSVPQAGSATAAGLLFRVSQSRQRPGGQESAYLTAVSTDVSPTEGYEKAVRQRRSTRMAVYEVEGWSDLGGTEAVLCHSAHTLQARSFANNSHRNVCPDQMINPSCSMIKAWSIDKWPLGSLIGACGAKWASYQCADIMGYYCSGIDLTEPSLFDARCKWGVFFSFFFFFWFFFDPGKCSSWRKTDRQTCIAFRR